MINPTLTLSGIPSAGALLGTGVSADILTRINQNIGTNQSFFGSVHDMFSTGRQMFVDNIITPIRNIATQLKHTAARLVQQDKIMPILVESDFEYIPPSMMMPILLFEPVRELHKQGRVDGFGFDPDNLPEEDVYGRLIDNGTVEDIWSASDKDGKYQLTWVFDSDDPVLSFDELDYIADTRMAILDLLKNTNYDPTNYPQSRG